MDLIGSLVLGVITNAAYDWLKAMKAQISRRPWDELYADALDAALRVIVDPARAERTMPGVAFNRSALIEALRQDLLLAPQALTISRVSDPAFSVELARAIASRTAVVIGDLALEDYDQQVRNLVRHATALYITAILSDDETYRRMETVEDQATRESMRALRDQLNIQLNQIQDTLTEVKHAIDELLQPSGCQQIDDRAIEKARIEAQAPRADSMYTRLGDVAFWHIVAGQDARRDLADTLLQAIADHVGEQGQRFQLIRSKGGNGKSTFLRRMAYELASQGQVVLLGKPGYTVEHERLDRVCKRVQDRSGNPGQRVYLLLDNVYREHLHLLLALHDDTIPNLTIIATSRHSEAPPDAPQPGQPLLSGPVDLPGLSSAEVGRLLERLQSCGALQATDPATELAASVRAGDPLLVAVARLTNAGGLQTYAQRRLTTMNNGQNPAVLEQSAWTPFLRVYHYIAAWHEWGLATPQSVLPTLSGLEARQVQALLCQLDNSNATEEAQEYLLGTCGKSWQTDHELIAEYSMRYLIDPTGPKINRLKRLLEQLVSLTTAGQTLPAECYDLLTGALRVLRPTTADNPREGEELLLSYYLPHFEHLANASAVARATLDKGLIEWIQQYPAETRKALRDKVLTALVSRLQSTGQRSLCWVIWEIGYRRDDVGAALWEIAERYDDETGDTALGTLAALGVPVADRPRLIAAANERAQRRWNIPLDSLLHRLADPTVIPVVRDFWSEKVPIESCMERSEPLHILARIADAHDRDSELQDIVLQTVLSIFARDPTTLMGDLLFWGDVAPCFNTPDLIPSLLTGVAGLAGTPEQLAEHRLGLGRRLSECTRPRQLEGLQTEIPSVVVAGLREDACRDTAFPGRAQTAEMIEKEQAWETLLRLGHGEALTWFEEGVARETNGYTRYQISELLACFQLDPLPPTVVQWVTERFDAQPGNDGELFFRMGAISIAASAATIEAFTALSNFGLTTDNGQVLLQSVNALASGALALVRAGEPTVIPTLVELTTNSTESRHRIAAVGVLMRLAKHCVLPAEYAPQVAALAEDESREEFERSNFVSVLGSFPPVVLTDTILANLHIWAQRSDSLGNRSLETLALHGHLLGQIDLLRDRLALDWDGIEWVPRSAARLDNWSARVLALLCRQDPTLFTGALVAVLAQSDWSSVLWAMDVLLSEDSPSGAAPLPGEIVTVLFNRATSRQSEFYRELGIFSLLAQASPDDFGAFPWPDHWSAFSSDLRCALADALGETEYSLPEVREQALALLIQMAGDASYAVRRSAYRGIARLANDVLPALTGTWAAGTDVDWRQRAAEASGWIGSEDQGYFEELQIALQADQEFSVRDAAQRAWKERRKRLWADTYLARLLATRDGDNDRVLDAWKYGEALTHLGDDSHIETIRDRIDSDTLPPHVDHWFRKVLHDTEQNWEKATRKWPEPWTSRQGIIEHGEGSLTINGDRRSGHYLVWRHPAAQPNELEGWGGELWLENWHVSVAGKELMLEWSDGRQAHVLCAGQTNNTVTFHGQGSYPVSGQ